MFRFIFRAIALCTLSLTCAAFPMPVKSMPGWMFGVGTKVDNSAVTEDKVRELIEECRKVGQVGSLASEENREKLVSLSAPLEQYSMKNPAKYPLSGIHDLIYSAAPGGSSGKVGPFVGKVTQNFVDDKTFINAVEFGPVQIALRANREVKSDKVIKVTFEESTISVFGQKVKQFEVSGGGSWKYIFCGEVDGKLVRVMETPSLFVLEQPL
mmetsp:Transcript_15323/g.21350  ORF Transcript_15323/g.21350 Transcript_15323/m.21350 type:complete len:211 (+) Transcript_15323:262-894(+)